MRWQPAIVGLFALATPTTAGILTTTKSCNQMSVVNRTENTIVEGLNGMEEFNHCLEILHNHQWHNKGIVCGRWRFYLEGKYWLSASDCWRKCALCLQTCAIGEYDGNGGTLGGSEAGECFVNIFMADCYMSYIPVPQAFKWASGFGNHKKRHISDSEDDDNESLNVSVVEDLESFEG
ncbi:hypothetical protein F4780DRAFT_5048 [Xylariomycetidae sp. FL0641]|nr:hypothetical protein F4780DRAFT_5048 [Xylariomycetidae sp. FL0641]